VSCAQIAGQMPVVARMPRGGLTDWNTDTESPKLADVPYPGAACQRIEASMWLLMAWMMTLWRRLRPLAACSKSPL